jgi:hypothetical protein
MQLEYEYNHPLYRLVLLDWLHGHEPTATGKQLRGNDTVVFVVYVIVSEPFNENVITILFLAK